jgi:tetratricopeptide (TPR) repeat protein
VAYSLDTLALLYAGRGNYANAIPIQQRVLSIRENTLGHQHPNVARPLGNLAMLRWANGDAPEALRDLQRAIAIQERNAFIFLTTGSDDQKRAYMATLRNGTDQAVSLHSQLAPNESDARRLALRTIVQRKGVVMDAMRDVYAMLRLHGPDQTATVLEDLESVSSQLGALLLRGPGPLSMEKYRELIDTLRDNREALEADLSRRSAQFQAERRAVSLEEVQAAIPDGAALVEIFRYRPVNPKASKPKDQWGKPRRWYSDGARSLQPRLIRHQARGAS